jgi:hypothetical protein
MAEQYELAETRREPGLSAVVTGVAARLILGGNISQ